MCMPPSYSDLTKRFLETKGPLDVYKVFARNAKWVTSSYMSYLDSVIEKASNAPDETAVPPRFVEYLKQIKQAIVDARIGVCLSYNTDGVWFIRKAPHASRSEIQQHLKKNYDRFGEAFLDALADITDLTRSHAIAVSWNGDEKERASTIFAPLSEEIANIRDSMSATAYSTQKQKADLEWDIYSRLERFLLPLSDFGISCLLAALLWRSPILSLVLFGVAVGLALLAGVPVGDATALVNTESFEQAFEGKIPNTTSARIGALGRVWFGEASIPQAVALTLDRAKARRLMLAGIPLTIAEAAALVGGISLSVASLRPPIAFALILQLITLPFAIAQRRIPGLTRIWGIIQLTELVIAALALYPILQYLGLYPLFWKAVIIATVCILAYALLYSATEAVRRAALDGSIPERYALPAVALWKLLPPGLFLILWRIFGHT